MREVHGWRRVARWSIGIFGGLVGLVVLLAITAVIVVQTGWGRGILRDQIAARLDSTFVGGATLGSVEGNPFSELVLNDLVIHGPDGEPAVSVKRLTVKVPLLPLISRQIRVDEVIADGLDVRLKKLPNGDYNLANLTRPAEEESRWSIELPDIEVHRGHLSIDRGPGSEPIDLDGLEVYVDARLPFAGPSDASAHITGRWRQREAPLSVSAVIHGDDTSFEIRNAGVQLGDVRAVALGVRLPKSSFSQPYAGAVAVHVPARAVRDLVPGVRVPEDVALSVTARPDGRLTYFSVLGAVGDGQVSALGRADVQARLASLVLAATDLELDTLTAGTVKGTGAVLATLRIDGTAGGELPAASGVITARSDLPDAPPLSAVIAFDSGGDVLQTTIGAASTSGIRAGLGAVVRKRGDALELVRGDVIARTLDVHRATGGRAPLRGVLSANLHAEGALAPRPNLRAFGQASGRRLRVQGASIERLALRIDARDVPHAPAGSGRLELHEVERGDLQLAKLTVAAESRPDGKLQVAVRSRPKPAPWQVDVDALVTIGETVVVELQRHFVRAAGGATWRGNTGVLSVGPRRIKLRDLRSTSSAGSLVASAEYARAGRYAGDLAACIAASVELGRLLDGRKGHVAANIDIARVNEQVTGTVVASAKGVVLDPTNPLAFDGDAKIVARADQLLADIGITTATSGSAKLALDVDAPKDVSNTRAWRTLGRDAIRTFALTLDEVKLEDVAKLAGTAPMSGRIDGTLELSPAKAGGELAIRDVTIPQTQGLGAIAADLRVAQAGPGAPDSITATLAARFIPDPSAPAAIDITQKGAARLFAEVGFRTPDRIFDPAAWQQLGPSAFRGGTLRAERLAFQPGTLERLGIVSALRGELSVGAEVEEGLREVRFAINVHELRGGLFAEPVAVSVVGALDESSTRANVYVRNSGITLLRLSGELPVSLAELRADPERVRSAPLTARARIEQVPARTLMTVIGTSQISGGTLDAAIDVGGTVANPTLDAKLTARGVTVPSEGTGVTQKIDQLSLAATWDGAAGNVSVDATQSAGGRLRIRAAGSPADLDAVTATIRATNVDIAPLVAFMPGPAGGLAGTLQADFALRGANPRTAQLAGSLHVADGRIPIAPTVGTLFQGDLRVNVKDQAFDLKLRGKLGRGDVSLTANVPLEGVTPKSGNARLVLRDVQLIVAVEPILSGTVDADLARIGDIWRSNVRITKMKVEIPENGGAALSPVGPPDDLVFGGEKLHHGKHAGRDVPPSIVQDDVPVSPETPSKPTPRARRRRPSDPALVANVMLRNVFVESEEVRGLVGGRLRIEVADDLELGIDGQLSLSRGVVELFSRRYEVDNAAVVFDGSTDPRLDIRITHDFPQAVFIAEVRGRLSDPDLALSSQPAHYSQAELLGFLLGGQPGAGPEMGQTATERVAGAGASLVSNVIGGYVKRALPIDLDVLRYEAATSTSSAAFTVGTWITETLFLAYRRRLEARPDENAGEGEFEYWIRRRLVLEGVIGDRGVNGLDLLWRRRW